MVQKKNKIQSEFEHKMNKMIDAFNYFIPKQKMEIQWLEDKLNHYVWT